MTRRSDRPPPSETRDERIARLEAEWATARLRDERLRMKGKGHENTTKNLGQDESLPPPQTREEFMARWAAQQAKRLRIDARNRMKRHGREKKQNDIGLTRKPESST